MEEIKEKILKYLHEYGEKCGNHCGLLVTSICIETGITNEEAKAALNELYAAKKVIYRDGAQGLLFFLNYKTLNTEKNEHSQPKQRRSADNGQRD